MQSRSVFLLYLYLKTFYSGLITNLIVIKNGTPDKFPVNKTFKLIEKKSINRIRSNLNLNHMWINGIIILRNILRKCLSSIFVRRRYSVIKPSITNDQMVKSSEASKRFGSLRKKAKIKPVFITENGTIASVLVDYEYYEKMYQRLIELEEIEEENMLTQRIERLEKNPELAVSWKEVRRSAE